MISDENVRVKRIPYSIEITENNTSLTDHNYLISAVFKLSYQIWPKTIALISLYHI